MGLFETKIKRLKKWTKGNMAPPLSMELVPTDKCNLNCKSCWRQGYTEEELEEKFSREMSDERLLELIDEAAEMGVREIIFVGGGEPLSRNVLPQAMKRIKNHGMEGDLVTNGTLITEDMVKMFLRIGWDRIKFSIDGPDPQIHDKLRGKDGAFERTINNIKAISKAKEELNVEKPKLFFNTVISNRNYKRLPEIVELGSKVDLDGIWLLPTTAFSESSREMQLNDEQVDEFVNILEECVNIAERMGFEDCNFSEFLEPKYIERTESMHKVQMEEMEEQLSEDKLNEIINKEYKKSEDRLNNFKYLPCYSPWHHITIRPDGHIAPCFSPWVWETETSVKNNSLSELWYGEYFDKYRNILLSRELPEQCKKCCVWEVFKNREIRKNLEDKSLGIF